MKRKRKRFFNRRGQVWVETVIYTLIAFVIIGLVLTFARPKINEIQDNVIISQSIEMLEDIDTTIIDITTGGQGNKRILEIGIKKGTLFVDGVNDKIIFEAEIGHAYSELESPISKGNLEILTEEFGSEYKVTVTRDYSSAYDVQYNSASEEGAITKSSSSYKLSITNSGTSEGKTVLDFEVV